VRNSLKEMAKKRKESSTRSRTGKICSIPILVGRDRGNARNGQRTGESLILRLEDDHSDQKKDLLISTRTGYHLKKGGGK